MIEMSILFKRIVFIILGLAWLMVSFIVQFLYAATESGEQGSKDESLIRNGGFEDGLSGWSPLWTRDTNVGKLSLDYQMIHQGISAARIDHKGQKDWSLSPAMEIPVQKDEIFELDSWVKIRGEGSCTLCVVTYDSKGVLDWIYASHTTGKSDDWQYLRSKFRIPGNVTKIVPRWIGNGPATIWLDDFQIKKRTFPAALNLPPELAISNSLLAVTLDTRTITMAVHDKRSNITWRQQELFNDLVLMDAQAEGRTISMTLSSITTDLVLKTRITLAEQSAEFAINLSGTGPQMQPLTFPQPFVTDSGTDLIVPLNEGISYPVEDDSIDPMRLEAYGGHGICMSFWGVTNGESGQMTIIETPDDASIQIARYQKKLCIYPVWEPQRGEFGYTRQIRYCFFHQGGTVAICKKYRSYIEQKGALKTLSQKRFENPNVDLLIGAVNTWCWDPDPLAIVRDMRAAGMEKILWSNAAPAPVVKQMNEWRILTSRYDIYQDVMDPELFRLLQYIDSNWPTEAWPNDIVINAAGQREKGWEIEGKKGGMYPCGVLCDSRATDYAARRIPAELKEKPYRGRFIDTTTAAPWRECYSPEHPMTRSQSKEWKMKLLKYVSRDQGLITGSETGHDAAVPYVHFFEGMMSLAPYRVDDAGRNMMRILDKVPPQVAKYQVGYGYRLPLWELVYHDCVVAYWYWGDYNNKIPAVWNNRDLFNILYATPPMFMFDRYFWEQNRGRFRQSYRNITPAVLAAGYQEMTNFQFITKDRSVQQSSFANGTRITVNFGKKPFKTAGGITIKPQGFLIQSETK
jgi:hypothetical protein